MTGASNRRGFFKELLGELAREAGRVESSVPADARPPAGAARPQLRTRRPSALPASGSESIASVVERAAAGGLTAHLDAVQRLARFSARLTQDPTREPDVADEAWVCGAHDTPPAGVALPHWGGHELTLMARFDLEGRDAADPARFALGDEPLAVFYALEQVPSGLEREHHGSCQVVRVPRGVGAREVASDDGRAPLLAGQALRLSVELQLPRVWSAAVQDLKLDEAESQAWEWLRLDLGARQGVEPEDVAAEKHTLHRLLGYPDEKRGQMPLVCELLDRGHTVPDGHPFASPLAPELSAAVGRWRLLMQLTADETLGWDFGRGRERLYVWIDERALAIRDFSRVYAIAQ